MITWEKLLKKYVSNKFTSADEAVSAIHTDINDDDTVEDFEKKLALIIYIKNTAHCYGCFIDSCKHDAHNNRRCEKFRTCDSLCCVNKKHAQLCNHGKNCSFKKSGKCKYRHIDKFEDVEQKNDTLPSTIIVDEYLNKRNPISMPSDEDDFYPILGPSMDLLMRLYAVNL